MTDVVVALDFAVCVSYFMEVWSDAVVEPLSVDSSAKVFSDVVIEALGVDSDVEVLTDVNINTLAAVMTASELPMPILSEEFNAWAAYGCRGNTVLDCTRFLQAKMPSYQV